MRRHSLMFLALLLVFAGCATSDTRDREATDAELRKLETMKWDPASFSNRQEFLNLFAPDFVSVEYGSDVQGGVHRKTRAEVFSGPPLPPAKFDLSEWMYVHPSPFVVIVSYRVKGLTFPWEAYAASTWALRGGKWQTVFYQASTAQ